MTLLDVREARELGPLGDRAWEDEPQFEGQDEEPVAGNYDDRRKEESEKALADAHEVYRKIDNGEII